MSSVAKPSTTPLHIVHHSLSESPALTDCLNAVVPNSAVLLIQNAVYDAPSIAAHAHPHAPRFYALKADLQARGIHAQHLPNAVQVIDYEEFVDLVERHNPIQSWF